VVLSDKDAAENVRRITGSQGAALVLDFVGYQPTIDTAMAVAGVGSDVTIVGIGDGQAHAKVGFFQSPYEASVTVPYWGARNELIELIDLAHAGIAELGVAVTDGAFTADTARLDAMVPGLAFGVVPGGITVVVGDVEAGDGLRVLLYARSKSGVWFGLHLVDAESARDTCTGGAEADMTLAGCVGSEW